MNIETQAVHNRVVTVGLDQVERHTIVGGLQGTECFRAEYGALNRQLTIERPRNIERHPRQPRILIIQRQVLMLVVIVICDIDLANLLVAIAAIDLRHHADLQPPIGRDT